MTGIMLKDFREAFCVKKNAIAWIFGVIMFLFFVIAMPIKYIYILSVTVMCPLIGTSVLQYSNEQDEISKFDKIMLTYPITRKEIILSKYLSGLVLQAGIFLFTFALALVFSFGYKVIDFKMAMTFWFVGIIFSLLFMAINYIIFFWLGNKKGIVIYIIVTVIWAFGYVITYRNVDLTGLLSMDRTVLMLLGFVLSVLALVGSYFASVKIYTKRHIK